MRLINEFKPKSEEFQRECEEAAESVITSWGTARCTYTGTIYSVTRREYELICRHSWGSAYCSWTESDRKKLIEKLKEIGAVNIINKGKMEYNYIGLAFNISLKKYSELIDNK